MKSLLPFRATTPATTAAPPSELHATAFFTRRADLAARLAAISASLKDKATEADALLVKSSNLPDASLPQKLSEIEAMKGSLTKIRAVMADQLAQHDAGFPTAADNLGGAITLVRAECLGEIRAVIRDKLTFAFDAVAASEESRAAVAERINFIVDLSDQVRAEDGRHWGLASFADSGSVALHLPLVSVYRAELALCHARLAAIREIRAGKRKLAADLSEFEHPQCHAGKPTKMVNDAYDPPESQDAFAARRAARVAQYQRTSKRAAMDGVSEEELSDLNRTLHPDRDPLFVRFPGSKGSKVA